LGWVGRGSPPEATAAPTRGNHVHVLSGSIDCEPAANPHTAAQVAQTWISWGQRTRPSSWQPRLLLENDVVNGRPDARPDIAGRAVGIAAHLVLHVLAGIRIGPAVGGSSAAHLYRLSRSRRHLGAVRASSQRTFSPGRAAGGVGEGRRGECGRSDRGAQNRGGEHYRDAPTQREIS
jgi:hypothetical protein